MKVGSYNVAEEILSILADGDKLYIEDKGKVFKYEKGTLQEMDMNESISVD